MNLPTYRVVESHDGWFLDDGVLFYEAHSLIIFFFPDTGRIKTQSLGLISTSTTTVSIHYIYIYRNQGISIIFIDVSLLHLLRHDICEAYYGRVKC